MKAIECTKYGTPEVLQMTEIQKPFPKDDQILIKIHATSATSGDARLRRADPFIIRLIFGWKKPRKSILGVVVAGVVETVGKDVTNFKVGDELFGSSGMGFGAYAEYVCVSEEAVLAIKPNNMTFEEAAAIPFGATASLHFLRKGNIQPGQKVLIYGASGALGTAAIQLAKNYGAEVTAVCSTANVELMKSLGADEVIDYTKDDFSQHDKKYDVFYDTVGKSSFSKAMKVLKKKGKLMLASASIGVMFRGMFTSIFSSKKVLSGVIKETVSDMKFLKQLIESNKMKAVIDKTYPLNRISDAHEHVDKGHKRGNVIVTMG